MSRIIIATRKSELALWQANHVAQLLRQHDPDLQVELLPMVTQGDIILDQPLAQIGDDRPGHGLPARGQNGLRAQYQPVLKYLQPVRPERGPGGGDVDDDLGRACRRRAFGGAKALDDPVSGKAMFRKEAARELQILGRDPQAVAMGGVELAGHLVEIGHRSDVQPALRHRNDHVGRPEPQPQDHVGHRVVRRDGLAQQVFAGHPKVDGAVLQCLRNLRRRQERNVDAVEPPDLALVAACRSGLDDLEARAREHRLRRLAQAALGWQGKGQVGRTVHASPPLPIRRLAWIARPTAGTCWPAPMSASMVS
jgi:hypothetical protein